MKRTPSGILLRAASEEKQSQAFGIASFGNFWRRYRASAIPSALALRFIRNDVV